VPVKVHPVKIFILYRFLKKIDICIKIKLFYAFKVIAVEIGGRPEIFVIRR
jgi:hypothetical protein